MNFQIIEKSVVWLHSQTLCQYCQHLVKLADSRRGREKAVDSAIQFSVKSNLTYTYFFADTAELVDRLIKAGEEHIKHSFNNVVGSDYAGSHWLASFLLHAMDTRKFFID